MKPSTANKMEQKILQVLKTHKRLTTKGISKRTGLHMRNALYRTLDKLCLEGRLVRSEEGFSLAVGAPVSDKEPIEVVVGNVHETFGFVREVQSGEELFVPGKYLAGALPGDRALLLEQPARGDLREGRVTEILEPADYTFTGVYHRGSGAAFIVPDSGIKGEITVAGGQSRGAREGDKVVAHIYKRGERHRDHKAQVVAVMGSADDARACAAAILLAQGVRTDFEAHVLKEAERLERAGIAPEEAENRLDLREETIFTIDGATAKDLDDAVSLRALPQGGWAVGVHIADVSHYVHAKSAIDLEAFERGTSIYYADQVIPMLPQSLSNGICSLNGGEDRLALSALMTVDEGGNLTEYAFFKSVIRSKVRGVYEEVNALLAGEASPELEQKYAPMREALASMDSLAALLVKKRAARGSIDLSSVETAFAFDEAGRVCAVVPRVQGRAEKLVEEFMLLANQAAARFGEERKLPFLYRIHEDPPETKLDALYGLLGRLGIQARRPEGRVAPGILSAVLESVRGTALESVVNSQILRTMAKARYSERNIGHYGLTMDRYSHFTSPIRRYPDLAVHRIISAALRGESPEQLHQRYTAFTVAAAKQSSERELRAMSIERACDAAFLAEYMQRCIGQTFDGVITGVVSFGFYVALQNSAEGLVHVHSLEGDTFDYDGTITLTGRLTGRRFRVGDRLRVLVLRADVSSGQIDFAPAACADSEIESR